MNGDRGARDMRDGTQLTRFKAKITYFVVSFCRSMEDEIESLRLIL